VGHVYAGAALLPKADCSTCRQAGAKVDPAFQWPMSTRTGSSGQQVTVPVLDWPAGAARPGAGSGAMIH